MARCALALARPARSFGQRILGALPDDLAAVLAGCADVVLAAVGPGVAKPKALLALSGADAAVGWATAAVSVVADPTSGFLAGLALAALLAPFKGKQD